MTIKSSSKIFRIYLNARKDYQQKHYHLAAGKLQPIIALTNSEDVNHLLVKSLYHLREYSLAEMYMIQEINTYSNDRQLIILMIKVFVKNRDFIKSREIVSVVDDSRLKSYLLKIIRTGEEIEVDHHQKRVLQLQNRFYHLSERSLIQQRQIWRQVLRLPFQPFMKIARQLLIDPFLKPIMRLSIIDVIRKMQVRGQIEYRWINDRIYSIRISELSDLTRMTSYRRIMEIVDQEDRISPINRIILKQNLRLELSYLYPFNDSVVKHPNLWVKVANLIIKGEQPPENHSRMIRIYRLQMKLNRMTDHLKK